MKSVGNCGRSPYLVCLDCREARGDVGANEDLVCVLTGAGVKWPDALPVAIQPRQLADADPDAVRAWIRSFDGAG